MKAFPALFWCLLYMALLLPGCTNSAAKGPKAHVVVAASDSTPADKQTADFVCNASDDQDVINKAIAGLPVAGGDVTLLPGLYVIRKTQLTHRGKPVSGGILINKHNVALRGCGPSTRLVLADAQDCNVVRITGVNNVVVEKLSIDANYEKQTTRDRAFESCAVRASWIHEADGDKSDNVVVRECIVRNAAGLGIMLWGSNVKALDNVLSNNQADDIELLGGPGEIRSNSVTRTKGSVDSMVGSDVADTVLITGNTLVVKNGAGAGVGIRSWAGHTSHVITGNVIRVEPGGHIATAIDSRASNSVVSGNLLDNMNATRTIVSLVGGNVATGNLFRNATVGFVTSGTWKGILPARALTPEESRPVVFSGNQLLDSTLDAKSFADHGVRLTVN